MSVVIPIVRAAAVNSDTDQNVEILSITDRALQVRLLGTDEKFDIMSSDICGMSIRFSDDTNLRIIF